jgi:Zn-finger nucleic acid-binding protein
MPLLLCPNCNTSMSAVNRQGVEFDMCPTCRGVWLDRGELEKLVAGASEGQARAPAPPPPAPEASYRSAPPVLGEHTNAVLTDVLKMSAGEIAALKDKGIL